MLSDTLLLAVATMMLVIGFGGSFGAFIAHAFAKGHAQRHNIAMSMIGYALLTLASAYVYFQVRG